jgi:voltage-dependent anion channel protein 2
VQAIYNSKAPTSNVALEVGVKSYLDISSFVKAKINNAGILGLGYTQALRPGVKASFGVAVDTQKLGQGGFSEKADATPSHSVGVAFTLCVLYPGARLSLTYLRSEG